MLLMLYGVRRVEVEEQLFMELCLRFMNRNRVTRRMCKRRRKTLRGIICQNGLKSRLVRRWLGLRMERRWELDFITSTSWSMIGSRVRCTVDLDCLERFSVILSLVRLRDCGGELVGWRVSSGGNGRHLVAFLPDAVRGRLLCVRFFVGDDGRRVLLDGFRPEYARQVLFVTKGAQLEQDRNQPA